MNGCSSRLPTINPYAAVDWDRWVSVLSTSHIHAASQEQLDCAYEAGLRHFPLSNYYPSAPYSAATRLSDFRLRQAWPARRGDDVIAPPVNWNQIITWANDIDEPYRATFPFLPTDPVFQRLPDDLILSSNAEHHGFANSHCHINAVGSSFCSGNFDARNRYRLTDHGFPVGYGGRWQDAFAGMLAQLDYPDGGGITINHPTWFSHLSDETVFAMLDFDDRVLGIEIYNDLSANRSYGPEAFAPGTGEGEPGFSLGIWDRILASGRRCWGFCVPDHSAKSPGDWQGRCVLMVPEYTDAACLRAYRTGSFYGCLRDNGLRITRFAVAASSVTVTVNSAARIRFISNQGVVHETTGTTGRCDISRPEHTFVRVEVADGQGERLFMQPVMLTGDCPA